MTPVKWLVVASWFLLAAYVIWRGFATPGINVDILFAAWLGGVVSLGCVWIVRSELRDRRERAAGRVV